MLTYKLRAVKASLQWDRKATKRTLRIVSGTNLERDHKPRRSPIRDFFRRQSHLTLIVGTHWVDSEKKMTEVLLCIVVAFSKVFTVTRLVFLNEILKLQIGYFYIDKWTFKFQIVVLLSRADKVHFHN